MENKRKPAFRRDAGRRPEHGVPSEYGETVPFYHGDDEPVHAPDPDDDTEPAI